MSANVVCTDVAAGALIERYMANRLDEAETEVFESHYLTCARCQSDLRLAVAIRDGLVRESPLPASSRRSWRWGGGLALALAAGLAAILLLPRTRTDSELAQLGTVGQPPIYLGVPVRIDEQQVADSLFDVAMTNYVAERYRDAASGLRAALSAGVDAAPAEFFLGASLLALDEPESAAQAFERVVALGETPYRSEAHFYLGKALLQLNRGDEALLALRRAAAGATTIAAHARALADSVTEVLQRSAR